VRRVIFSDLEELCEKFDIESKYVLTVIVSQRARFLSEQKGRYVAGDSSEKYISTALQELVDGKLRHSCPAVERKAVPGVPEHVVVEE